MNYKSFNLGDWIGHIGGIIEDETTLDGNEMRDLVEFLSTLKQEQEAVFDKIRADADGLKKCLEIIDKYKAEPLLQKVKNIGKWVKDEKQEHVEITYHCSKCGFQVFGKFECSNFCPNCGNRNEVKE